MQNVPKIVLQRLKAAPTGVNHPPASHPDANVLSAFAERTLREDERAIVLEHLSRCGDCRDVLALALPATELAQTPMRPPAREWLAWPAMRWGFAAAGVVAIAALGLVQHQRRVESAASKSRARFEIATKEAENQPLASPVPASTKKADNVQSPAAAPAYSVDVEDAPVNRTSRMSHADARPAPAPPQGATGYARATTLGGPLPHGPRLATQWQQQSAQQSAIQNQASVPAASSPFAKQQAAGDLSANLKVPGVSETVTVENPSAQLDTQAQNLNTIQIEPRQSEDHPAAAEQSDEDYGSARVGKAKPAENTQTIGGSLVSSVSTPAPSGAVGGVASSAPIPRWNISSTGKLQRSIDQGTSWQVVDVNATAYFTDATSIQISGKTSGAKARKMASPIFRAVAAIGLDVWAGGSGGALYHSLDAGDHWTRVTPTSPDAILTGDIVSLEFADMQHGKVSTSDAEVWTTNDAGQTWQRQ